MRLCCICTFVVAFPCLLLEFIKEPCNMAKKKKKTKKKQQKKNNKKQKTNKQKKKNKKRTCLLAPRKHTYIVLTPLNPTFI